MLLNFFMLNLCFFLPLKVTDTLIQMDHWCINKFCQHLVIDVLLDPCHQSLKSYEDGGEYKANLVVIYFD